MKILRKKSIAIVIPGGVGTGDKNIGIPILKQLIKKLSQDFNVTVFQFFPVNKGYRIEGFELISIYSKNSLVKMFRFFFLFRKEHRKRQFNNVHAFWAFPTGFLSVIVGKIFNIPSLVSLQGGDAVSIPEIQYGQLLFWWKRKLIFWSLKNCNELISPTKFLLKELGKNGFVRNNVRLIPLGVDINFFDYYSSELESPIKFLHIGNLSKVKDQTTLIRAFKIIHDKIPSVLDIIGKGPQKESLQSLVNELSLQHSVSFLDDMPNSYLRDYYRSANILLHTSLSEGHPIVVEEAMSCGLLVCGTKVGLLFDLPDCCVSVRTGDFESLAREVLDIINDLERRKTILRSAAEWSNHHSMDWTVQQLTILYGGSR